jgi:hypothetical protein
MKEKVIQLYKNCKIFFRITTKEKENLDTQWLKRYYIRNNKRINFTSRADYIRFVLDFMGTLNDMEWRFLIKSYDKLGKW